MQHQHCPLCSVSAGKGCITPLMNTVRLVLSPRVQKCRSSVLPVLCSHPLPSELAPCVPLSLQAEAANVVNTVAAAAEGYPFVPPAWAPSVFVPLTCLFLPGVVMASLFDYIVSGSCGSWNTASALASNSVLHCLDAACPRQQGDTV